MEENQSSFQLETILKSMNLSGRSTSSFDSTPNGQQHNFFEMVLSTIHVQLLQMTQKLFIDAPFDFKLLNSLVVSLQSINKHFLSDIERVSLSKCENIFDTIILLLIKLLKQNTTQSALDNEYLSTVLLILQEIIRPFPQVFTAKLKQQDLLSSFFSGTLISFATARAIIYSLCAQEEEEAIAAFLKAHLNEFLGKIVESAGSVELTEVLREMTLIATLLQKDFITIVNDYYTALNRILGFNSTKKDEAMLKDFFIQMTKLMISDKEKICYALADMLLKLYEENIANSDVTQAIIISLFTTLTGEIYLKLIQSSQLLSKFISQLHKERHQDIIAYFFYFLNSLCLSYEVSPNVFYTPKMEFTAIIESLQLYADNEDILLFIFDRIKSLFEQSKPLGCYFLEHCGYFEKIQTLIATKSTISNSLLNFTEYLFKVYLTPSIWEKAANAELLSYDLSALSDPITQKKIHLTFIYEHSPNRFNEKASGVMDGLRELIVQKDVSLSPSRDSLRRNCSKFLILLDVFLKALAQSRIDTLTAVNGGDLFKGIIGLIEEYTAVCLTRANDSKAQFFPMLNSVFACISAINESLLRHKFITEKGKKELDDKSEFVLFTKQFLKKLLKEIILKQSDRESKVVLAYLFEKCLCFDTTCVAIEEDCDQVDVVAYISAKFGIPEFTSKPQTTTTEDIRAHSNLLLQSQMIFKCLLSILLQCNIDFQLAFLSFSELLCNVNTNNIPLLLQCGLMEKCLFLLHSDGKVKDKAFQLLSHLIGYADKKNLALYFKFLYKNSVLKEDIALSKMLLSLIEANLASSSKRMPSCALSPDNSLETNSYQMYFLNNKQMASNVINVYLSLCLSSVESLNHFALCHLTLSNKTMTIAFEGTDLHFSVNKQKKGTVKDLASELPLNTWIKVHIDQGSEYTAVIRKNYLYITFPEKELFTAQRERRSSILQLSQPVTAFDFAGGFISQSPQEGAKKPLTYKPTHPVLIDYLAIVNQRIEKSLIEDIAMTQSKTMRLNVSSFSSQDIISEIFFSQIALKTCSNLAELQYKMSLFDYDITHSKLLTAISSNTGLSNSVDLFLLKADNINQLIKSASMSHIFSLSTANKDTVGSHLFPPFSSLDSTINDVFFADFIYALLDNAPKKVFLEVYQHLFHIVFVVNGSFQFLFFNRHITHVTMLLIKYAPYFNLDFVSLFIYNKYVEINELLQYDIIAEIFFSPYLYTALPFMVQTKLNTEFEKFLNYYESNCDTDYARLKRILLKLWNLIIHFEIDDNVPQGEEKHITALLGYADLLRTIIASNDSGEVESLNQYGLAYYTMIKDFKATYEASSTLKKSSVFYKSDIIKSQIDSLIPYLEVFKTVHKGQSSKMGFSLLAHHFWFEFNQLKHSIQRDKELKRLRVAFQLLWPNELEDAAAFSWNLYKREGNGRMRRKMALKLNPPTPPEIKPISPNSSNCTINEELTPYQSFFQRMSATDKDSDVPFVKFMIANSDKVQASYICLLIQKTEEIESMLVIGENSIYIFTNIICDQTKRVHLSTKQSTRAFWAKDEDANELDRLVGKEKKEKEVLDSSCLIKHTRKDFQMKTIPYSQIAEMHQRRYMLQNNSIEVFLLNGSSYFITVCPNRRDPIFSKIISNINEQSSHCKIANYGRAAGAAIYLKNYPLVISKSKLNRKPEIKQSKALVDMKTIRNETSQKWTEGLISNFNYIMLVNTLCGRTYNDLSQYFIFPWVLKDFFSGEFCLNNKRFYRDFVYPVHAQSEINRNSLHQKVSRLCSKGKQSEDSYHSGIYVSNISFIAYYMVRIKQFAQVCLDIQGGKFDSAERIFSSSKTLSIIKNNAQEWIPELAYLPELMVNMNNFSFNRETTANDLELPQWAKLNPRLFGQTVMKAIESPLVSGNVHHWLDLVFGNKMPLGKHNFDYFNRYLAPVYPSRDSNAKKPTNELNSNLYQSKEFGSTPMQLIAKSHPLKTEGSISAFQSFFATSTRITNSKVQALNIVCGIRSKQIGDMKGLYELQKFNASHGLQGLGAFTLYLDPPSDSLEEEMKKMRPYLVVGKDKHLIGPKYTSILSHSKTSVYIISPFNASALEFPLNEEEAIKVSIASADGKYVTVGLSNGSIVKYRKKHNANKTIVYPLLYAKEKGQVKKAVTGKVINPKVCYFESDKELDYYCTDSQLKQVQGNGKNAHYQFYYLTEEHRSSWPLSPINKLVLCESQSLLIATDQLNNVFLFDFNALKLMYTFSFSKTTKSEEAIRFITVVPFTGDFILGSKTSLHLFSINGVYLASMNTTDDAKLSPITSLEASSTLNDTIVFTGHSNGSLCLWKITTIIPSDISLEENSSRLSNQPKPYFGSYHRRYNASYDTLFTSNQPATTQQFSLVREWQCTTSKLIHLKLTDDLMHLIIVNNKKELLFLGCDNFIRENSVKGRKCSTHKSQLVQCKSCKLQLCDLCNESEVNRSSWLCEECSYSNISAEKLIYYH